MNRRHARRTMIVALSAALAASGFAPPPSQAAWNPSPENGGVPVASFASLQTVPQIVSDGAGGTIHVWEDWRNGAPDIYAQRLGPDGTPLWTTNGVRVTNLTTDERFPVALADGNGGVIIAWQDTRTPANGNDIYAQRLNASGVATWASGGVDVCTFTGAQEDVRLTSDGAGGAILSWNDLGAGNRDIYAGRVNAAGSSVWFADGNAVCVASGSQYNQRLVPDGAGGAIIVWQDERTGQGDIYAQRVNPGGGVLWTANGVVVAAPAGIQERPALVEDATGGAIVAWTDLATESGNVLAQRISPAGALPWGSNASLATGAAAQRDVALCTDGVGGAFAFWEEAFTDIGGARVTSAGTVPFGGLLVTAAGTQSNPTPVEDGAGGVIVAWTDTRNGSTNSDLYAQRYSSSGIARWSPSNGIPVSTAASFQSSQQAVAVEGGLVTTFVDSRLSVNSDVFAQRVDRFGYLGDPGPVLRRVRDVAGDQGGQVRVSWDGSDLDGDPWYVVTTYAVFRSVPESAALRALAAGMRRLAREPGDEFTPGTLTVERFAATTTYWEFVGSAPAVGLDAYSYVAPTTTDSIAGSNPWTAFRVQARNSSGSVYWFSQPDSGYSVDDLAPATPAPFAGSYAAGTTILGWGANLEPDLASYRLYRGESKDFVPGPGNLVATLTTTTFTDTPGTPSVYKLSAVDVHGNESGFALLIPGGVVDAGPGPGAAIALGFAGASPNPARGEATIRYALPREGRVRLAVYSVDGRRVRTLVEGVAPAGAHALRWDTADATGAQLASGIYLLRFEAEGRTFTRRVALVR